MARIAACLMAVVILAPVAAIEAATVTDGACEGYLAARERLAPLRVPAGDALRDAVNGGAATTIEITGDVSGKASSARPSGAENDATDLSRMLMMTLDDGSHVVLRAGEGVDRVRVGERVAVIASISSPPAPGELVVEAWVREWDLPSSEDPADQDEPTGTDEAPLPPEIATPGRDMPRPAATATCHADAVETWKQWVLEHNSDLTDEQARNVVTWVLKYSQKHNVNHKLIFALIKWESWFDPSCVSHAGAIGLMQVMPGTARYLEIDPYNVQQNIDGGVRYIAEQLATYQDRPNYQRVILALACYNAGPNAVKRAGHRVPNITETRRYVKKVSRTFHELHQDGMP